MLAVDGKWVWDSWFVDVGDAYHVFFLQAPRSLADPLLRHWHAAVGHAVSTDLRRWAVLPDALASGEPGTFDDVATWTGCVVPGGTGWAMFYTGLAAGRLQTIAVAHSDDLVTWHKHADNPIVDLDTRWYEPMTDETSFHAAWRDPWVYGQDGEYHMLITARRADGPTLTRGVIGRARSEDLLEWRVERPLTVASDFAEMEVPQLLDVDGRRVLIFSCGMAALAPHRRAEPGAGGSYYLVLDDDPTPSATAVPLRVPGLYACRVVWDRAGEPQVIGFVDRDERGRFGGTLSDPIPFESAAPALFSRRVVAPSPTHPDDRSPTLDNPGRPG